MDFETSVGIQAFTGPDKAGVTGIFKQRFSDFIVREVLTNGEVVRLRDISGEQLEKSIFGDVTIEEDSISTEELPQQLIEQIRNLLNTNTNDTIESEKQTEIETAFVEFLTRCIAKDSDCPTEFVAFPCTEKSLRTEMHKLFKGKAAKFVESDTFVVNGIQHLRLHARHKMKGNQNSNFVKRAAVQWPKGIGNYLKFTLLKENVDTMSAIVIMSKNLHINQDSVTYGGTKDKRAITAQKCTINRRRPSDFKRINQYKHFPTIRCGDFEFVDEPIKLGEIGGNRFEICLRSVSATEEQVQAALRNIEVNGFINYYGLQRFGKGVSKSHIIGKSIMISDWQSCIDLIFAPASEDKPNVKQAKELIATKDYRGAGQLLSNQMYAEKCILRRLTQNPDDAFAAYNSVPKNTRLICAHAYQSYLWNKAASKRIQEFGTSCIVGDLVMLSDVEVDDTELEELDPSSAAEIANSGDTNKKRKFDENEQKPQKKDVIDLKSLIHVVTADDIEKNVYSMSDVVLPLPGNDVVLPANVIGEYYLKLLEEDGLSLQSYQECIHVYRMSGAYRKVVRRAKDLQWELLRYSDPNEELAKHELSMFRDQGDTGHTCTKNKTATFAVTEVLNTIEVPKASQNNLQGLLLQFTLPPGTYATMLLRELTKESTETMFQANLTAKANAF